MRCGNVFKTGKNNRTNNGGQYGQGSFHKCTWYKHKIQVVRCTESYNQRPCYYRAATCLAHEAVPNAPKELLDWLKRLKIQLIMFTIRCGQVNIPKRMLEEAGRSAHENHMIPEAERMKRSQTGELV